MIICENNPRTYIARVVKDVLQTMDISKASKNYIALNKKLKAIDSKLVDLNGNECTTTTFVNQSLEYFDNNYPQYKNWRGIVSDAVSNYVITESYFNY